MAGTGRAIHEACRRQLVGCRRSGGARHRRAACAASPPTTNIALRDGGYWVVVGGQVARDEAGNLIGKGDLGAQIEQVGKNVSARLNAGGATVKDVIFTVSYVTEP